MNSKIDKNTQLLIKSDRFVFKADKNTGFNITRGFDSIKISFEKCYPTQTSEENDVLKGAKFNQNYITFVPKIKKTNNEGCGFASLYEGGLGFMATQEVNLLTNFIQTIENKGIEYVKDLQFVFYVRNPEKQKTSSKIIHSYSILYSKNIKD